MTSDGLVRELFARQPQDRLYLSQGSLTKSFGEVYSSARKLSEHLPISPGTRVVLSGYNTVGFVESYFAILLAKGIVVPASPLLTDRELRGICWHARAEMLIREGDAPERLSPDVPTHETLPEDLAAMIYTSGSTGDPKGVMLTARNIRAQIAAASEAIGLRASDRLTGFLSLAHVFGQMDVLWSALYAGCQVHLLPRFRAAEALALMRSWDTTMVVAVPAMYGQLLSESPMCRPNPSLRLCHSGGAPMPVSLLNRLEAAWEVYLQEGYGLTETCSMAFSNPPDGRRIPGSVGLPIRGCEYRIGDSLPPGEVGEVRIRGPVVSSGYFPAAESKERWLHTGDLGYSDPHGYLHLVDRSKDVVVRLGLKVYPREVEEVLLEHSQVKEAAVIGRPYRHFGQSLEAYVVPEATDEKICPEALKAWCQGRLAKHKVPSRFRIVRELPKTTSGKIAKAELRKR